MQQPHPRAPMNPWLVLLAAVCGVFAMATTGRAASDDVYLVKLALRDPAGLVDSPGGSLSNSIRPPQISTFGDAFFIGSSRTMRRLPF